MPKVLTVRSGHVIVHCNDFDLAVRTAIALREPQPPMRTSNADYLCNGSFATRVENPYADSVSGSDQDLACFASSFPRH